MEERKQRIITQYKDTIISSNTNTQSEVLRVEDKLANLKSKREEYLLDTERKINKYSLQVKELKEKNERTVKHFQALLQSLENS